MRKALSCNHAIMRHCLIQYLSCIFLFTAEILSTSHIIAHLCGEVTCHMVSPPRPHFYQTRSAWSVDQGSNKNHSPAYNFAPTVTKFCVMWEGLSLPHDTKFGNCRCKIVDSRSFPSWSLIHGLRWSGLIKVATERQIIEKCPSQELKHLGWQNTVCIHIQIIWHGLDV